MESVNSSSHGLTTFGFSFFSTLEHYLSSFGYQRGSKVYVTSLTLSKIRRTTVAQLLDKFNRKLPNIWNHAEKLLEIQSSIFVSMWARVTSKSGVLSRTHVSMQTRDTENCSTKFNSKGDESAQDLSFFSVSPLISQYFKVKVELGGCALNTVRIFQWLSGKSNRQVFRN